MGTIDPTAIAVVVSDMEPRLANMISDVAALNSLVANPNQPPAPSMPPLTPQEISAGIAAPLFYDDFTNPATIDFGLTYSPGFKWYSAYGLSLAGITMVDSVLGNLQDTGDADTYGGGLSTMLTLPAKGPVYNQIMGTAFAGTRYIETKLASNVLAIPGQDWTAVWHLSLEQLQNGMKCSQQNQCLPGAHVELDVIEIGANVDPVTGVNVVDTVMSINRWDSQGSGTYPNCAWSGTFLPNRWARTLPPGFGYLNADNTPRQNRFGTLVIYPEDFNDNGAGMVQRYINDFHVPETDVLIKPGDPLYLMFSQSQYLIIGGHPSWFDYVLVRGRNQNQVLVM